MERQVSWDVTERCLKTLALHEYTAVPELSQKTRTEYFPAFTESFAVVRVDHVDDGVTIVIVSWPN